MLRVSRLVAALVIVPLVALAAYGLSLRVRQYGWTPERITASACVVVAACYAIGYAVVDAAGRAARCAGWRPVNVTTAFVIVGVLLALFSPAADPIRISVNDQVQPAGGRPDFVRPIRFRLSYASRPAATACPRSIG